MAEDMERQVDAVFQPTAKVYCGACFYYVPSRRMRYGMTPPICRHPHATSLQETYEGMALIRILPVLRNQHQDCADWRQKSFFSDVRYVPLKRVMVLLAVFLVLAWFWGMLHP